MSNSKTCTIEGCERPHRARGMCTTHRYRFDNGLPMEAEVRQYEQGERNCKVDGCEQPRVAGGDGTYCPMHRRRVDRRGEVGGAERQRAPFNAAVWNQPENRRRYALLDNYGLTVEQYDALLLRQNYRCAICRTDRPENARAKSARSFCIDHDHETGAVRGLLCHACNRGIGMLGDNPDVLESAAQYLRKYVPAPGRPVSDLVEESVDILREHLPHLLTEGVPMAMSNADFKGRAQPTSPAEPCPADGAEACADNSAGYASHEQATAAAHAHHAKEARKVGMH